jgi:formylglycine-generating enzyme required for sulfatase activity
LFSTLALTGAVGCGSHSSTPPPAQPLQKFTQTIPATLVTFEMIPVPAGEKTGAFWIGKTEVTWDEFDIWAFSMDLSDKDKAAGVDAESRPSQPYGAPDRGFGHQGYAALGMTHEAAIQYCKWLSRKTGRTYRLPSEAEWQHACRGGEAPAQQPPTSDLGWTHENSNEQTHPVATSRPNQLGIYDLCGNVAEWCEAADGSYVVRGGSFVDSIADAGCAVRRISRRLRQVIL